eukprot:SAG31_NODE_43245_length_268_cov_0.597633_1_plen_36_part_01
MRAAAASNGAESDKSQVPTRSFAEIICSAMSASHAW